VTPLLTSLLFGVETKRDGAVFSIDSGAGRNTLADFRLGIPEQARYIERSRRLHRVGYEAKVAVLGTGVNPGFLMDALPIALDRRL
jgi:hypothetical protein